MFMRTERLFLRPVFPEDWREVYRGIADFGVVSMLARAPWPYRPADAMMHCRKPAPAGAMKFAVTLPELAGAPVIGQIGIEPDAEGHELGYWIARQWQRRGYASEAVRGVLDMAAALGVEQCQCRALPGKSGQWQGSETQRFCRNRRDQAHSMRGPRRGGRSRPALCL